ncbi:hypothetical protein B0H17DRAFT_1133743 [Mycena rosella]|uniref:Uncharacterized protein n=1 Tax=Mycena rosella TaxID=1033263 RepID=A0AAD7GF11_MYCRO|nr:hypothetical protein B0H17DRAFT_1133743 [Mycena rosella]
MVSVNFSALLALTMAAVAVAGPVAPVVDSVNRNWHRDVTAKADNVGSRDSSPDGVDSVNRNWHRDVIAKADNVGFSDSSPDRVDSVNRNWHRDVVAEADNVGKDLLRQCGSIASNTVQTGLNMGDLDDFLPSNVAI